MQPLYTTFVQSHWQFSQLYTSQVVTTATWLIDWLFCFLWTGSARTSWTPWWGWQAWWHGSSRRGWSCWCHWTKSEFSFLLHHLHTYDVHIANSTYGVMEDNNANHPSLFPCRVSVVSQEREEVLGLRGCRDPVVFLELLELTDLRWDKHTTVENLVFWYA